MDTIEETVAPAGHNDPPPLTPLEQAREMLADLTLEAGNWLDGAQIENEAQASALSTLLDAARKAKQQFDKDRKIEKAPHETAAKTVDLAWKPLITDADRILECARAAQTKWLIKLDEAKREEARLAREAAEKAEAEARRLAAESDGSLEAAKARDAAIEESKRAAVAAGRADREKAQAKGEGVARAQSLRTYYSAQVDDRRALLNHIAERDPASLIAFVEDWANKAVRAGARVIPGVTVIEERRA